MFFLLNQAIDLVFDEGEEENDDEIEMIVAALNDSANSRTKTSRIKKWCEETVSLYTDREFFRHFRMSRTSAERMCQFISTANCLQQKQVGGKSMVPHWISSYSYFCGMLLRKKH